MAVRFNYGGTLYGFIRDRFTGIGEWIVLAGRCPLLLGYSNANAVVPVIFGNELTEAAKEQGITEDHNFSRNKPKPPPPPKRVKGPKAPRKRRATGLVTRGIRLKLGSTNA